MHLTLTASECQCTLRACVTGFLLYGLFFYYFVRFYYDTYIASKINRSKEHLKPDSKNVECQLKKDIDNSDLHSDLLSRKNE